MEDLTYEEKIERILKWAEKRPKFDTAVVEEIQEYNYSRGYMTDYQEKAIDNIYFKWHIDRYFKHA